MYATLLSLCYNRDELKALKKIYLTHTSKATTLFHNPKTYSFYPWQWLCKIKGLLTLTSYLAILLVKDPYNVEAKKTKIYLLNYVHEV